MDNSKTTTAFFSRISTKARDLILSNIAAHYGISLQEALEEVTHPEAEHLLDYVTGPQRAATQLLMGLS